MQTNKSVFRNYKLNEIYLKNNKLIIKQNSAFSSLDTSYSKEDKFF